MPDEDLTLAPSPSPDTVDSPGGEVTDSGKDTAPAGTEQKHETLFDAISAGLTEPAAVAATPAEKAPAKADPAAATPPADDPNAEPAGLKAEASKRFRHWMNEAKTARAELEEANGTLTALRTALSDAGASQEDFTRWLSYQRAVTSGDYAAARAALQQQMRDLALASGEPIEAPDPLTDYPDLRERVNSMYLEEKDALQVARTREIERQLAESRKQEEARLRATQTAQTERAQAGQSVAQWAAEKAKADVNFAAIEKVVMPQIRRMVEKMPPAIWRDQVELLYDQAAAALAAAGGNAATGQGFSPLRPSGGAGKTAPATLYEAMWGK